MKQEWSTTCIHSMLLLSQNHMQIATWCSAVNEWGIQYQGVAFSRRHACYLSSNNNLWMRRSPLAPQRKFGSIKMVKHGSGNAHTPKSNARQNISYEPYMSSRYQQPALDAAFSIKPPCRINESLDRVECNW